MAMGPAERRLERIGRQLAGGATPPRPLCACHAAEAPPFVGSGSTSPTVAPDFHTTQLPRPLLSPADHAFWRANGYLVVPDVVPRSQCEAVIADLHAALGISASSPLGQWYGHVPEDWTGRGSVGFNHTQSLWDNRQTPKLYQAFAELHGTHRLGCSGDKAHMKLPYRAAERTAEGSTRAFGDGGYFPGATGDSLAQVLGNMHWDGDFAEADPEGGWRPVELDFGERRIPVDMSVSSSTLMPSLRVAAPSRQSRGRQVEPPCGCPAPS